MKSQQPKSCARRLRGFSLTVLRTNNKGRSHLSGINIVREMQIIVGSANYPSAVKFEKSVRHDRPAATRSVITVELTPRRDMVSQAYLRMPFKSKDSCHECSRIKETANSAAAAEYFYNAVAALPVVGEDTRGGVRFRHESSANERVCRPYRDAGPQVELNPSKERSNLIGGFLGLAAARSRTRRSLTPSSRTRRHPFHPGEPPSSHPTRSLLTTAIAVDRLLPSRHDDDDVARHSWERENACTL